MASSFNCIKHATTLTGGQIRAARALLNWSRDTLGAKADVSVRTLVSIEAGEGNPTKETLILICDALTRAGVTFIGDSGVQLKRRGRIT